jgi:phospholipid/cholesterol/gamma-HCH transport system substrate-binding protein
MGRRAPSALLVLACVALAGLAGCGRGGGGTYHLTAEFESTVGLYPSGDVRVMGVAVGTVTDIEIDGTKVRVEMEIDEGVPLPADVQATIGQTQLIGERNVLLFPPWDESMAEDGAARAEDEDVIPLSRTVVPVEPDEGLEAFNDLAQSLDADKVSQLLSDSADVLDGRGELVGATIDQAADLGTALAEVDEQLAAAAEHLHVLAGSLSEREEQLGQLVDRFSQATAVLAAERDDIGSMLAALVDLTDQGQRLLDLYGDQLPADIAAVTQLASTLEENASSAETLIAAFPDIAETIRDAYQPAIDGLYLRANLNPTLQTLLDVVVDGLGLLGPGASP